MLRRSMGRVIDFQTYKDTGKVEEVTIVTEKLGDPVSIEIPKGWIKFNGSVGLSEYSFVQIRDMAQSKARKCYHINWEVLEEGYSAMCIKCGLKGWTAPW